MDRDTPVSSERKLLHDPFADSARKRVEWSRERSPPVPVETPRTMIPPKLPQSMLNLMNSRPYKTQTYSIMNPAQGLSFDPVKLMRELSPQTTKNIDIEEMCDKSNPAYKTYDQSSMTRKSRLFDTPTTHPTENRLAWSSSLAGSQIASSLQRDSRSMLLTGQMSPQLKESTILIQNDLDVRISDFQVRPQTPKGATANPLKNSTAQFSIYMAENLTHTPSKQVSRIKYLPEASQRQNNRVYISFNERTFSKDAVDRKPLLLRGTSLDLGSTNLVQRLASANTINKELDDKIAALRSQLKLDGLETNTANLDRLNQRLEDVEREIQLVTNSIEALANERNQNAKRLQYLFQVAGAQKYRITPEDSDELLHVNSQLKQKLKLSRQELKSKTEARIESLKQKCLKHLEAEAKFVRYRYATDRRSMISDMNAYAAYLEDRIANCQQSGRPSNI